MEVTMEGQGSGRFQLIPAETYSENFKRMVVREFERGSLNKKDPQKQRIKELEKELENERLKVIAFKKLIEIAEREDGISISKKDVARQLKILRKSTREK